MIFNITFVDKGITRDLELLSDFNGYVAHKHVVVGTNLYNLITSLEIGEVGEYNAGCANWECLTKVKVNKK